MSELKGAMERQRWFLITRYKDEANPEHWGMRCGLFHGHTDIYWAEDRKQFLVGVCVGESYWSPKYFNTVFECMWYVEQLANTRDEDGNLLDDDDDNDDDDDDDEIQRQVKPLYDRLDRISAAIGGLLSMKRDSLDDLKQLAQLQDEHHLTQIEIDRLLARPGESRLFR